MAQDIVNKTELIERVAFRLQCTLAASKASVDAVLVGIEQTLLEGSTVRITGFGTFEPRVSAARKGRNPQTGAAIDIPAKRTVHFTPAAALKSDA